MLHQVVEGARTGGRIVLVHGFTQTLASWDPVVELIGGAREIVRVDLPGHGGSSRVRATFDDTVAAIALAGGPDAVYIGYSMGGRLVLAVGLHHPSRGIVLLGASPGIAEPTARAARRQDDDELAASVERDGVRTFLARWLAQPMFASLDPRPADLLARQANLPEGLASALRSLGSGAQPSLWDELPSLDVPALLMAGERDRRFLATAQAMAEQMGPLATCRAIRGAGHAAHLEQPAAVADAITTFASDLGRRPTRPH